ncbi:hypothetical protein ACT89H_27475, partial [Nocardia sp. R7R-8]
MTSAEIWPAGVEVAAQEPETAEDQQTAPATPWSSRPDQQRSRPGAAVPGQPNVSPPPGQAGAPAPGQSAGAGQWNSSNS